MGLLTFVLNVTLDGCVDHQEGIADDETHAFFSGLLDESGAMLWGRTTYEMMEVYWPLVARGEVEAPPALREWAVKLEAKPKYVVSSTRKDFSWNDSHLITGELRAGVQQLKDASPELIRQAKTLGYSDRQLGHLWNATDFELRSRRKELGITPTFRLVDTCAAEFEAYTPYYYSTYDTVDETRIEPGKKRVMILGGGPNRIGQGIEFDYCCCHAAYALREEGYESIMVNSNPETV